MLALPRSPYRRAFLRSRVASRAASWIAALAAAIFLLQWFAAAAHHDHELAAKSQHCVACALHAQPHGAPPDMAPAPPPLRWMLLQTLAPATPAFPAPPAARYLLPPSHAPPAFLSLR